MIPTNYKDDNTRIVFSGWRWLYWVILVIFGLCSLTNFSFATRDIIDLGTVKPYVRHYYIIAIPGFEPAEGGARTSQVKPEFFPLVIYRDLELSGYFRRPENQNFVGQNHRRDIRLNKIDFAEWRRLKASFLLKGNFAVKGNKITVGAVLYDTASGQRIFGKRYTYPEQDVRSLAHRISDDIIHYVAHTVGIASTKIAFISTRTGKPELFIMDADGANQRPLTQDRSLVTAPCWGAKGTEIYFTSYKNFNPDLYGISIDGSRRWLISARPGFNLSPDWSEKTQRIVLTLSKDGNSELYTMTRDGKNLQRLTYTRYIESSPSWSPDGKKILFTSDRIGLPQIYVMDANGYNQRRITFQGRYNDSAVWSPKGDKIAFTAKSRGFFNIFLMNPDGSEWVQLTVNQGNNEEPSWAPDGEHIAFVSDRTGKPQIFVMCIDGTNQTQLTFQGSNYAPAWSPLFY